MRNFFQFFDLKIKVGRRDLTELSQHCVAVIGDFKKGVPDDFWGPVIKNTLDVRIFVRVIITRRIQTIFTAMCWHVADVIEQSVGVFPAEASNNFHSAVNIFSASYSVEKLEKRGALRQKWVPGAEPVWNVQTTPKSVFIDRENYIDSQTLKFDLFYPDFINISDIISG